MYVDPKSFSFNDQNTPKQTTVTLPGKGKELGIQRGHLSNQKHPWCKEHFLVLYQ